jgi:hypothetical protein
MTWMEAWLWELLDNALYLLHLAAVVLVLGAAIACPALLWLLLVEARETRREEPRPCQCECRCHHDDGPVPVLPRVLPRLRRIGEDAE